MAGTGATLRSEDANVAFRPKADMTVRDSDVRFRGQSGHPLGLDECLLMMGWTTPAPASECHKVIV